MASSSLVLPCSSCWTIVSSSFSASSKERPAMSLGSAGSLATGASLGGYLPMVARPAFRGQQCLYMARDSAQFREVFQGLATHGLEMRVLGMAALHVRRTKSPFAHCGPL